MRCDGRGRGSVSAMSSAGAGKTAYVTISQEGCWMVAEAGARLRGTVEVLLGSTRISAFIARPAACKRLMKQVLYPSYRLLTVSILCSSLAMSDNCSESLVRRGVGK